MKIKEKCNKLAPHLLNALAQDQNHHNPVKVITPGMPELLRRAAAESAVLLENRVLPLKKDTKVSVFGRVQCNWFYTGYGSGGDVNAPYRVNLLDGLRNCENLKVNEALAQTYEKWCAEHPIQDQAWGRWPRFYPEMPLDAAAIRGAAKVSDQAIVVIGRSSGEDRENTLEKGSYYLTDEEKALLTNVKAAFPDAIVLLNIGSVMDFSFIRELNFGAVLLLWQGGMESGNAAADLLCGKVSPSGHLTDTVAHKYEDYPSSPHFGNKKANKYWEDIFVGYRWFETFGKEKVLYPFGYGLTYTNFSCAVLSDDGLSYNVTVTNTGSHSGRFTPMLFVEKPCSLLGTPARELVAFGKSRLLSPGESQTLTLTVSEDQLGIYCDREVMDFKSTWVLQNGTYRFWLGDNARDTACVGEYQVETPRILKKCTEAAAPARAFPILAAEEFNGQRISVTKDAIPRTKNLKQIITDQIPEGCFITGDKGYKLKDVKENRISMDTFVAQLDLEELEAISRGGYIMGHPLGAKGNAGIFGGVTQSLRDKGVPPVVTTDGPSGIRLYDSCSLLPIGTALACSFDTELAEELYRAVGLEMRNKGSDVLLAPGMNIHRNPLCGRNFEYFSEDPLLTGKMAAAIVRGVQSTGLSACPKHFACNNQEVNRKKNDSILSERALREIYLKGFEICVAESAPRNLMTSYNKINGVWGHYHFDLVQTILRGEWGYEGNVMTDWWMQYSSSPEFPKLKGNGYRVRAGVNVLMPGSRSFLSVRQKPDNTLLSTYKKPQGITLGEMQRNAAQVLQCVMDLKEL